MRWVGYSVHQVQAAGHLPHPYLIRLWFRLGHPRLRNPQVRLDSLRHRDLAADFRVIYLIGFCSAAWQLF